MLRRDPAAEFRNRGVERLPYGLGRRTCRRLRVWLADKGVAQRQSPQVSPSQQTANHIEYGGFQIPLIPSYVGLTGRLWLERGNAYVVANLRGGGEFGPQWHQTAQGATKQRTWDDFIAVAEDLIRRKITSPRRMGVVGGSQGGLLVGTAITQRPELFNAAILQVPLLDMVRFTKLGAGASWIGEYGDPTIPEQRKWLEGYSPYQTLVPGKTYPAPFILTSTKDDRVHPAHGRKAATSLAALGQPYLYYENTDGGHSVAANLIEQARGSL
ncbi:prolyl oligopeptidase family serine peptidase [Bradyrhizobium sp. WSM1743]|uniref:prolyl oligopeptidase family serine peptidase n=1 Tax=Bradyrhizobium sp. WSM1743 TaxID=318996 RepID=UPI001FD916E6|nr:prolyl oligopeptidase family serine peptidase [Bradyrhizobium sp. WSM1743]